MIWNPFRRRPVVSPPSIDTLADAELIALASVMAAPLDRATFDDPEALLAWLCAHAAVFDREADARPAVRGVTGIDAFARWADAGQVEAALADERVDAWSLLGHGEQTYLYWDRAAEVAPRVVELDHEQRNGGLVMHDWRGPRAVLLGLWARHAGAPGVAPRACYCSLDRHRRTSTVPT